MNNEIIIYVFASIIMYIVFTVLSENNHKRRVKEINDKFKKEDERLAKMFSDLKRNSGESKTVNATKYKAEITIPFSVIGEVEASIPDMLASEIVEDMKKEIIKKMKIKYYKTQNTEKIVVYAEINGVLLDSNK